MVSNRSRSLFSAGTLVAVCLACLTADAQTWKQIGNFPGMNFRCAYFWDTAHGIASIRVVDATGKEVLRDNEEVTFAGTHFFYFTANKLPAGTYYYTIEFPQGVAIASKTMLVVE